MAMTPSLSQPTLDAVTEVGFNYYTPVQSATISRFVKIKIDAATGSGKTLAFVVPLVQPLAVQCKGMHLQTSFPLNETLDRSLIQYIC
ncbi:hypothetical protein MKW92_043229 [Papaver armeniacum]|nr:hypothetical protein MKW92_043229 [Papaver armeniacum]